MEQRVGEGWWKVSAHEWVPLSLVSVSFGASLVRVVVCILSCLSISSTPFLLACLSVGLSAA